MTRWAPDARDRLETAALELFAENGYESTTVAEIADRAGLNRATFFRHFTDKREVLFGGEDPLSQLFAEGIRAAPSDSSLTDCLNAAFSAADSVMTPQQRVKATQRVLFLAANLEVQERGLLKRSRMSASIRDALRERGTDELAARLGAELGMLTFSVAMERWLGTNDHESFAAHAADALRDLADRAAGLESSLRLAT
jgi:AcrR family transcriptional regulator